MPAELKRAMVLAAGYGARLRPLTDRTPKPLVPVAGRPMIEYALDHLKAYGIGEIVINVSHLKDQLVAWLAERRDLKFKISEEPEPLETGGGLKQALPLLGDEPFFTINSDIIWLDEPLLETKSGQGREGSSAELPIHSGCGCNAAGRSHSALGRLVRHWDDAKMDVLLLAQTKARAVGHDQGEDHLFVKPENTIGWEERDAPYIIAGVGVIHPRVLRSAPEGKFSVKLVWLEAMKRNRLFCLVHRGRWFQTGTVEDVRQAEQHLLASKP